MTERQPIDIDKLSPVLGQMSEPERYDYYVQLGHRLIALRDLGGHYARPEELAHKASEVHLAAHAVEQTWLHELTGIVDKKIVQRYL